MNRCTRKVDEQWIIDQCIGCDYSIDCGEDCEHLQGVIDLLAKYENTGLTPQQVIYMQCDNSRFNNEFDKMEYRIRVLERALMILTEDFTAKGGSTELKMDLCIMQAEQELNKM